MSWFGRKAAPGSCTWPYTPDEHDRVVPLGDVPHSSIGAPIPTLLASEGRAVLLYLTGEMPEDWDGSVQVVSADSPGMLVAAIEFRWPDSQIMGLPWDETFIAHPLAGRGLHPNGAFTVESSSWIRALERMSSVHPRHDPKRFFRKTHYVFSFVDTTFECVAEDITVSVHRGSLRDAMVAVASRLA